MNDKARNENVSKSEKNGGAGNLMEGGIISIIM